MAIVTATIAAVSATMAAVSTIGAAVAGAATVGAAVAATASAVAAVSTVVGMVGLVVTTVGAITGNEDLLAAGEIMGYVGMAGTIAGWGTGFAAEGFTQFSSRMGDLYSKSWDKGLGKMFSSGADDLAGSAGTIADKADDINPQHFTQAKGAQPGISEFPAPGGPNPIMAQTPPTTGAPQGGFLQTPASGGNIAPSTIDPTANLKGAVQAATSVKTPGIAAPTAPAVGTVTPSAAPVAAPAAATPSAMDGFFSNPMMPLAAGQILSGGVGGLFDAGVKEDELEMKRIQMERDEAQRQYMNRNNTFTPGVSF